MCKLGSSWACTTLQDPHWRYCLGLRRWLLKISSPRLSLWFHWACKLFEIWLYQWSLMSPLPFSTMLAVCLQFGWSYDHLCHTAQVKHDGNQSELRKTFPVLSVSCSWLVAQQPKRNQSGPINSQQLTPTMTKVCWARKIWQTLAWTHKLQIGSDWHVKLLSFIDICYTARANLYTFQSTQSPT